MADKPGRRWRETELTGKQKAERVMEALREYSGLKEKVAIDKVLSQKLGLRTSVEREAYRKAYQRWHKKILAEMSETLAKRLHEEPGEGKQRQPLGPKEPGMVWQDGAWQDIEPAIPPQAGSLEAIRRNSGQYPRKK